MVGVFFLLTGCGNALITDKRVVDEVQTDNKVFQLYVDGVLPNHWVTVNEQEWDRCPMFDQYPSCAG